MVVLFETASRAEQCRNRATVMIRAGADVRTNVASEMPILRGNSSGCAES
jgi:hypothetical protein